MNPDTFTLTKEQLIRLYNMGYHAGHHDTVEGQYIDILWSDMGTYHEDVVEEILSQIQDS